MWLYQFRFLFLRPLAAAQDEKRMCWAKSLVACLLLLVNHSFGQQSHPKIQSSLSLFRSSYKTRTNRWRLRSRTMQIEQFLKFNFFSLVFFSTVVDFHFYTNVRVRQYLSLSIFVDFHLLSTDELNEEEMLINRVLFSKRISMSQSALNAVLNG